MFYEDNFNEFFRVVRPYLISQSAPWRSNWTFDQVRTQAAPFVSRSYCDLFREEWKDRVYFFSLNTAAETATTTLYVARRIVSYLSPFCVDDESAITRFQAWLKKRRLSGSPNEAIDWATYTGYKMKK